MTFTVNINARFSLDPIVSKIHSASCEMAHLSHSVLLRSWKVPGTWYSVGEPADFAAAPASTLIHPRVDAGQSQNSISLIHRRIDVKSQFPLPLTWSMAPTAGPKCSSKNLGWPGRVIFPSEVCVKITTQMGHTSDNKAFEY